MRRGFSLVELSIVLVVIGLLTGGVLAGKSLIRASELRTITADYSRYVTATQAFRDKYFALPGDMLNASSFWGALDGNNGTASDCRLENNGTNTSTCNGDGDGRLCYTGVCSSTAQTYETFLFWQHLANGGLIEGKYSGFIATNTTTVCVGNSPASDVYIPGCNTPVSKLSAATWVDRYLGPTTGDTYLFDGNYGNVLIYTSTPSNHQALLYPVITPREMWNIDTKMDDGKPALGKLVTTYWGSCDMTAASVADVNNAAYELSNPAWSPLGDLKSCTMIFREQF